MPVESVYARLEPLLPLVRKPVQYVGGELNCVVKDWDAADVRWALMYPDAYEVGIANQGIQILYEVLNGCDGVLAERTYSVWPDLEAILRSRGIPQFTVDAHRPVRAFDVLGVSFATELGYTNLLTALDLAGIPLSAAQRGEEDPLVIAGGHAAFNPEPIAEFCDGAVLGDGEQAVLTITELIRDWKRAGRPGGRDGLLAVLAADGGVYVPRFYDVDYLPDGRIRRVAPNRPEAPFTIAKHTVMDLDDWQYPAPADRARGRVGARAVQRGDLPRLHPRLPVLPGGDDHPAGPRAEHHHDRGHGRARARRQRLRRGRPALAVQRRPQRDQRHRDRPG